MKTQSVTPATKREVDPPQARRSDAPDTVVVPEPARVLALQRSAGNTAVAQLLGTRVDRRDPNTNANSKAKDAPKSTGLLKGGRKFTWIGAGLHIAVVVDVAWLKEKGVAGTSTPGSKIREIWSGITTVAPWLEPRDIAALENFGGELQLQGDWAQRADVPVRLQPSVLARIGPRPGREVEGRISNKGAFLLVSGSTLRRLAADQTDTEINSPELMGLIVAELERIAGAAILPKRRAELLAGRYRVHKRVIDVGRSRDVVFSEAYMTSLFGDAWEKALNRPTSLPKDEVVVGGHRMMLPPERQKDWPKLRKLLEKIVKPAAPGSEHDRVVIDARIADLLLSIDRHPRGKQLLAKLADGGGKPGTAAGLSLASALETVLAQDAIEQTQSETGMTLGSGERDAPISARPVRGTIVNNSGILIPRKEATFSFRVDDDVDAFKVPRIRIKWVAHPKGDPKSWVADDVNRYSPLRGDGILNDRTFDVTFTKFGDYVIRAVVDHNFFLPNAFEQEVRIKSEDEVLGSVEKRSMAGFKLRQDTGGGRKFDVGAVTDRLTGYSYGWQESGTVDPKFTPPTLSQRLDALEAEVKRVNELRSTYASRRDKNSKAIVSWADDFLEAARASIKKIRSEGTREGQHLIPAMGSYVSRTKGARTGSMNLICFLRSTDSGFKVVVHDASQLIAGENFRFSASGPSVHKAFERAFIEVTEGYPDGKMSVAFQVWDPKQQKLTNKYVQFERQTDTAWKDIKRKVFGTVADVVVNLGAAVIMVFNPMVGLAIAITYNAAKNGSELLAHHQRGTLTSKKVVNAVASLALDVMPVIGSSKRIVTLGRKAYYVFEAMQMAGDVYLITSEGLDQIRQLRDGVIKQVADIEARIRGIEAVNPSDPRLDKLRKERDKLIGQARTASTDVFTKLIASQGVSMASGTAVTGLTKKTLGKHIGDLEVRKRFEHTAGADPHYDHSTRKIVADRDKLTPDDLARLEHQRSLDDALVDTVTDAAMRKKIGDQLADVDVTVRKDSNATVLDPTAPNLVLHVKKGASANEILAQATRARAVAAASATPAHRGKTKTSAPAGTAVSAKEVKSDFGMPPSAAIHAIKVAKEHKVVIDVRAANKWAPDLYAQGAHPKPEMIKSKTVNELDLYLGMTRDHLGKAAHFKPPETKIKRPKDMSLSTWKAIEARRKVRLEEFKTLDSKIKKLEKDGKIRVTRDNVILAADGKPFTGDFDLYRIRNPDGSPLTRKQTQDVLNALRSGPFAAQHGAHTDWKPKNKFEQEIYAAILAAHQEGGEGLLRVGSDGKLSVSYHETPHTPPAKSAEPAAAASQAADQGSTTTDAGRARTDGSVADPKTREQRIAELSFDPDKKKVTAGRQLEVRDAIALEDSGVIPGPIRSADGNTTPAEHGADFVDAHGNLWDHKQAVSQGGFDAKTYVDKIQQNDLANGERLIVNHERLDATDLKVLLAELDSRRIRHHFIFVPKLAGG